jgi:hypothetical protein
MAQKYTKGLVISRDGVTVWEKGKYVLAVRQSIHDRSVLRSVTQSLQRMYLSGKHENCENKGGMMTQKVFWDHHKKEEEHDDDYEAYTVDFLPALR